MRFPFSFVKSSAAAAHDPATDNLSLWLRTDSVSGTGATLAWASKASAGSSGSAAPMLHETSYGDTVEQPSTALDGHDSVLWTGTYPLLTSADYLRTALLGAGDSTPASYTAAYVVQLLASNTYAITGGGKVDVGNPTLLGNYYGEFAHAIMSDGGTAKFGVYHYNQDTATGGGTTPFAWPGGFGGWGLAWVSYTSGGNVRVRVNGVDMVDESIVPFQGPTGTDYTAYMGSMSGGSAAPEFRMVEAMVFPGQALSTPDMVTREQGYFKTRYPTLGL